MHAHFTYKAGQRIRIDDLRVDWFQVIVDLGRRGFPLKTISDEIRTPRSTVLGWKQGAEPKHSDGERLIAFWCQASGKDRGTLPMIGRFDWRA